jgi:hypothetical protein
VYIGILLGAHYILHISRIRVKIKIVPEKKLQRKLKHTFYVQKLLFSPEIRVLYEIMWKIIVQPGRPLMSRRQYGACALHAEYPRLKAHTI